MKGTERPSVLFAVGLQLVGLCGCGRVGLEQKAWHQGEVEVSPGSFIEVEERSTSPDAPPNVRSHRGLTETVELRIHWGSTNVSWTGNSGPINLREFRGRLFLITLDRVSKGVDRSFFRYYAQEANELKEIPPTEFPKAIAGQNMGFYQRYFGGVTGRHDAVKIALNQDPSDIYFRNELTAQIWNHLATGEQYWQSSARSEIIQALLQDYIRTNNPVKLTAIIPDVSGGQPAQGGKTNLGRSNPIK